MGQNNSGKSNILSFLNGHNSSFIGENPLVHFNELEKPRNYNTGSFVFETGLKLQGVQYNKLIEILSEKENIETSHIEIINKILQSKTITQDTNFSWFCYKGPWNGRLTLSDEICDNLFEERIINEYELNNICVAYGLLQGGETDKVKMNKILNKISPINNFEPTKVNFVPAIREVGGEEINVNTEISDTRLAKNDFSGYKFINQLAKLQNPNYREQHLKSDFEEINKFLQTVIQNDSAKIEIPVERDMILVHLDGKSLPLTSLGTGIHEVIILAAAATIIKNEVICIEEPEIHLHPLLQKHLLYYLKNNTKNQYFIATHSSHLLEIPEAAIFHVRYKDSHTKVENISSDSEKSSICADLGYRASDLLQANCIIWVEGPSDRIYLNHWIVAKKPEFIEGIHYSIMTYGGKLLSHMTADEQEIDDFISLRRLNRNISIVIDRDRDGPDEEINSTKVRIRKEFNKGEGFAWITKGREIENYINPIIIIDVVNNISPEIVAKLKFGIYKNCLKYTKNRKTYTVNKVKVANEVTTNYEANFEILDLERQMKKLINFISDSNDNIDSSK
ncbi:AAA family ATPase [Candidatus Latescibacterota bacterium]